MDDEAIFKAIDAISENFQLSALNINLEIIDVLDLFDLVQTDCWYR